MLRLKGLRSVVLWGALSIAALANLVYASSLSATGTYDDFNLASIVVVAVAGTLLVGTLWYKCRGCCCCCCRRGRRGQDGDKLAPYGTTSPASPGSAVAHAVAVVPSAG
jgi:hypothetical protein